MSLKTNKKLQLALFAGYLVSVGLVSYGSYLSIEWFVNWLRVL